MTGGRDAVGTHCVGWVKTFGTLVTPGPGLMLSNEHFFALEEEQKVVLSTVPCLVVEGLDLPCLYLFLSNMSEAYMLSM